MVGDLVSAQAPDCCRMRYDRTEEDKTETNKTGQYSTKQDRRWGVNDDAWGARGPMSVLL